MSLRRSLCPALVEGAVLIIAAGALLTIAPETRAQAPTSAPAAVPAADPTDVQSIDAIIGALYDVISGPAGEKRDWDRMRSLFIPGARLIPIRHDADGGSTAFVWSVDEYIQRVGPRLEEGGFFEREIARRAEQFGNIAHLFSTYDSRRTLEDAQPFARGINSIQLQKDGDRWWIVSIMWDQERQGLTIPAEYLR